MTDQFKLKVLSVISIIVGVLPLYLWVIVSKIRGQFTFTLFDILGWQLIMSIVGIVLILALNRYLLKSLLKEFSPKSGTVLLDAGVASLLLIIVYLLEIISVLTWETWILTPRPDRSQLLEVLMTILRNPGYLILLIGPVVWAGQTFLELSRVFLLRCLWNLHSNRIWLGFSIVISAAFICLLNIDNGYQGMIFGFLSSLAFNITYLFYRRLEPLIYASVLFQTIGILGAVLN